MRSYPSIPARYWCRKRRHRRFHERRPMACWPGCLRLIDGEWVCCFGEIHPNISESFELLVPLKVQNLMSKHSNWRLSSCLMRIMCGRLAYRRIMARTRRGLTCKPAIQPTLTSSSPTKRPLYIWTETNSTLRQCDGVYALRSKKIMITNQCTHWNHRNKIDLHRCVYNNDVALLQQMDGIMDDNTKRKVPFYHKPFDDTLFSWQKSAVFSWWRWYVEYVCLLIKESTPDVSHVTPDASFVVASNANQWLTQKETSHLLGIRGTSSGRCEQNFC